MQQWRFQVDYSGFFPVITAGRGGKRIALNASNEPADGLAVLDGDTLKLLLTTFDEANLGREGTIKLTVEVAGAPRSGKRRTQRTQTTKKTWVWEQLTRLCGSYARQAAPAGKVLFVFSRRPGLPQGHADAPAVIR